MKYCLSPAILAAVVLSAASAAAQPPRANDQSPPPHADKIMSRLDSNGDGVLTLDEFHEPRGAWQRFDDLDSNNDGALTLEEVTQVADQRAIQHRERLTGLFRQNDLDGDGRVTESERKQAAFDRLDADHDGMLSVVELANRPHRGVSPPNQRQR